MKKWLRRVGAVTLAIMICFGSLELASRLGSDQVYAKDETTAVYQGKMPKYIFLFIGDGMSYPQITAASDYQGKMKYGDTKVGTDNLNFMSFPVAGSAQTFDSTSLCPDSASTATSVSTGKKTHSGVINMDEEKKIKYETISEKLKKQFGYKIGIITSVSIDHATPAAFYAHQPSRGNYYEIGVELANSGFDYFGGGGFLSPTGKNGDQKDVLDIAKENGYAISNTREEILGLNNKSGKTIAISPILDSANALPYAMDASSESLTLAQFTQKGIDVINNDKGFFMMVEGGKIDWACHANDATASIKDTIAFSEAVGVAIDFAKKYPEDTLIVVTADHETGGLTIGFSATGYSTYFEKLAEQKVSYDVFDDKIKDYKADKTPFTKVLEDIKADFGLITADDFEAKDKAGYVLTDFEYKRLEKAYEASISDGNEPQSEEDAILYGTYDPLTVTVTHILNQKSGIGFTSYSHTGLPVPVFAQGVGAERFNGFYDNTDIFNKLQQLTHVK